MSAPTVYRSIDAGAPVLDGTAGSLLALLDAVLVNGYGSQPAAGWSKNGLANAGSKGAFKQGAGGTGDVLWVDDSGALSGTTATAACRGFETLTAVTPTGTNSYPSGSAAQNDIYADNASINSWVPIRKSVSTDATVRQWIVIADAATFWIFTLSGDLAGSYTHFGFGDIVSFTAADAHKCFIIGRRFNTSVSGLESQNASNSTRIVTPGFTQFGHYSFRTAISGAVGWWIYMRLGIGSDLYNGFQYPGLNLPDQKIYLNRFLLTVLATTPAGSQGLRGYLRGVYQIHDFGGQVADGDTFSGTGDFAGRSFLVLGPLQGNSGALAIETSVWDT